MLRSYCRGARGAHGSSPDLQSTRFPRFVLKTWPIETSKRAQIVHLKSSLHHACKTDQIRDVAFHVRFIVGRAARCSGLLFSQVVSSLRDDDAN
jgi:hypothetical protein